MGLWLEKAFRPVLGIEFLNSAARERRGHGVLDDEIKELIGKKMKEKLGEEE